MRPIDFDDRRRRLADNVKRMELDAYVGTRQASLHWINGAFMPWRGALIADAQGTCETLYWKMDAERARVEGAGFEIREFERSDLIRRLAERLEALDLATGRIGLDLAHPGAAQIAPGMLTAQEYLDLRAALPEAELVNGVDAIDRLMLCKDAPELDRLRQAARVAERGFRAGLAATRPGVSENEIAGEIEREIRRHGSTWSWAVTGGTEVGGGERTAFRYGVTQQATDRKIRENEFVILDLHPLIDLYMADFALPVFLGTPTVEQQRLIDCWEAVIDRMFEVFKPGARVADCARAAHARFEAAGYAELGLPLFGHGLGTCARTRPFINPWSDDTVEEGMVLALGCHLYVPDVGGLRLEYPAEVTATGLAPLGEMPPRVVRKPL